ncbi:MAG: hypothetical protein JWO08_1187 [Verrucomicrobiaceae bacterium]|nr:hypothetical protein [Verrucomicrobiaceae bacterium]
MPVLENKKAEACAQLLFATPSLPEWEAYMQAFGTTEKSAKGNASAQMENHGIRERVKELQGVAADAFTMTRVEWLHKMKDFAEGAEEKKDFSSARACLREIGLACDWYKSDQSLEDGKLEITVRKL